MKSMLTLGLAALIALATTTVNAQDWRREPTFGATYLQSGFLPDPATYSLTAGGGANPVNVADLNISDAQSGQRCGQSFIARSPDFRFYFQEGSSFNFLRFYVVTHNGADATLLVNMPNTQWRCNDDSFGTLMPSLDFNNPPSGQYDIWVGTWDASSHNPATFYITELQQNTPAGTVAAPTPTPTPTPHHGQMGTAALNVVSMAGNFAPITVAAGFMPDPQTVNGTSGGTVQVSSQGIWATNGGSCAGWVSGNPDHIVTLTTPFNYLRIDAVAATGGDTTMVVQDPYGNWLCDDDGGGYPNPRIAGAFQPGMYRIWIGSYGSGDFHPYNLSVSEFMP
jgi:hypothetical protein